MVFFPVEVMLGRATGQSMLAGLAAQATWIVLALLALRVTWKLAGRRYSAVGG
jgi:ABC-type uncharacterized transport system permease subunit